MPILGIYASQNYVRGLTVDALVVAGGGAGGTSYAGGGGEGGFRTATLSLALNTSFSVTVGAGAAAATYPSGIPTSGSDSIAKVPITRYVFLMAKGFKKGSVPHRDQRGTLYSQLQPSLSKRESF